MVNARWWPAVPPGRQGLPRISNVSRPGVSGAILLAAVICGVWGCDRGGSGRPPGAGLSVILISMDTTRADHLACYGHPRIETPNIDRLAGEGTLFARCSASVPLTLPSHASILTGTHPYVHKVRSNGAFQLHADNLSLAEVLRDAGYATAAQVGAFVMNRQFGLDQGFATYRDVRFDTAAAAQLAPQAEITAEAVTDGALALLQEVADRPFFLFVHYFDPHEPYAAPWRFASQYLDSYVAEIAYTDAQIGRLLEAVTARGLDRRTLIVLTGDHGEGRGQHYEDTHGYFLYETTLAVPLILWAPGRIPASQRIEAQVRTVDIAPTALAFLGLPPLPDAQGVDLMPLISGRVRDLDLAAYAETFYPRLNYGFSHLRSLSRGEWKYIHAPEPELYRITEDPRESWNLAPSEPQRVAKMHSEFRRLLETAPRIVGSGAARRPVSPDDARNLQALGYLYSAPDVAELDDEDELALLDPAGSNPMEHVREIRLANRAVGLVLEGKHAQAEEALRSLLTEAEKLSMKLGWAHAYLAGALAANGKLEEALEHIQLAVQAQPRNGIALAIKGKVLQALGRTDEAIAAYRQAVAVEPVFAITHLSLGTVLATAGQEQEAIEQYRLAIKKDPLLVRAYAGLAELLAGSDRLAEVVEALDRGLEAAQAIGDTQRAKKLQALRARCQRQSSAGQSP